MKSHVVLLGRVLDDLSIQCCTSTELDHKRIESRVEREGISFLTITLPNFGKDFEKSLDQGFVDSTSFVGFQRKLSLPAFLQGLTSQVFNPGDGVLLDAPSIDAIRGVRQVCYLFKALDRECSDARTAAAFDQYIETDNQVAKFMLSKSRHDYDDFRRVSMFLFSGVLSVIEKQLDYNELLPKHGPGSTAERRLGNAKYDNMLWTERLEEVFAASDFLFPNLRYYLGSEEDVTWLTPEQELPVRVVSVPKTLKTPRIIAIEPTYQQYVQQAFMEVLVDGLEHSDSVRSFIGFTDQEPNRFMACHGSRTGSLATLDLSEASDRVSTQHVTELLRNYFWISKGVFACRSAKAEVPGHGVHTLAKFASMGSALTFPLEAMVFLTLVFLGIEREKKTPISHDFLRKYRGRVRVYGDDIIVPADCAVSVQQTLEDFGLKVNENKSFWTGKFRESCGGDYYDGVDVTPVKCRRDLPLARKHVSEISSAVAFRNQMNNLGYWKTVEYLDRLIERLIPFPKVLQGSPVLGRHDHDLVFDVDRVCPHLHRPLVRGAVVVDRLPDSDISGRGALLKYFLKRGDEPHDKWHLERAGRPVAVNMKLRWMPPY